jgi:hypothetical protein
MVRAAEQVGHLGDIGRNARHWRRGEGFEPPTQCYLCTAPKVRRLRPLSHLSLDLGPITSRCSPQCERLSMTMICSLAAVAVPRGVAWTSMREHRSRSQSSRGL